MLDLRIRHNKERILSLDRLRSVMHYAQETGDFTWFKRTGPRSVPGVKAGTVDKGGYVVITVDGQIYKAHRLAMFYVNGEWPAYSVDHINGIKHDNRFCNLRDVSHAENLQNQRSAHSNSIVGMLGVSKTRSGKWVARIKANKVYHYLGTHESATAAHSAYLNAKLKMHIGGQS